MKLSAISSLYVMKKTYDTLMPSACNKYIKTGSHTTNKMCQVLNLVEINNNHDPTFINRAVQQKLASVKYC